MTSLSTQDFTVLAMDAYYHNNTFGEQATPYDKLDIRLITRLKQASPRPPIAPARMKSLPRPAALSIRGDFAPPRVDL